MVMACQLGVHLLDQIDYLTQHLQHVDPIRTQLFLLHLQTLAALGHAFTNPLDACDRVTADRGIILLPLPLPLPLPAPDHVTVAVRGGAVHFKKHVI
jgi:hypothetical protein